MPPELDPKHAGNLQDPFPMYDWLREHDPVHWADSLRGWMVTRYEDAHHVLQNPLLFSADRFRKLGEEYASKRASVQDVAKVLREWFVLRDPPDHTRMRRVLHNSFTPRDLSAMRPRIQQVVDELFDRVASRGEMDFVEDFAFPLPASVIAIMLGCPIGDIDRLKIWSDELATFIGGNVDEVDNIERAKRGLFSMCDYFREEIERHRREPDGGLICLMLEAEDEGEVLTAEEVVANCVLLMVAGHETTTNLLSMGLYYLLRNPDQLRLLRADPGLIRPAVEEFLRYDGPVPAVVKVCTEDTVIGDRRIKPGEMVFPFLSGANRDPAQFDDPNRLDITRDPNRHLAFGYGIHFCLGAPLARVEAQIAFSTLLRRFDNLVLLEDSPPFVPQIFLRGLERVPVGFEQSRASRQVSA